MKIDTNEIKAFMGCDDTFLYFLMGKYVEESEDCMRKMLIALDEKNWQTVKGMAHKMLGSSRVFSPELSARLEEIINRVNEDQNTDQIAGKAHSAGVLLKDIIGEINTLRAAP